MDITNKLTGEQLRVFRGVVQSNKGHVVVTHRQWGKTTLAAALAVAHCVADESGRGLRAVIFVPHTNSARALARGAIQRFVAGEQDVTHSENLFRFKQTNAELHILTDSVPVELFRDKLFVVVDEARDFQSNVLAGIQGVGVNVYLTSMPEHKPHACWSLLGEPYHRNRTVCSVIDNPGFSNEQFLEVLSNYPGGIHDPAFRRDWLCEASS